MVNSSNKTKTTWNIINGNINEIYISFIRISGTKTHDSQVIANTFNTYFLTLAQHIYAQNFKNLNSEAIVNNPLHYLLIHDAFQQMIPPIRLKFVSSKDIEDVVNSLKMKNSYGYDGISTKFLKQSISYISSHNRMISTGIFPTRLKFAGIKPLHKNGEITNTSNYRYISLLTSFSKICEKFG